MTHRGDWRAHGGNESLALFASGDGAPLDKLKMRWHVSQCADCRAEVESFRAARAELVLQTTTLPAGLAWDRLAEEMTANIHLGLEAGECVNPFRTTRSGSRLKFGITGRRDWRAAIVMAGMVLVLLSAWFMNPPLERGGEMQVRAARIVMRTTSAGLELNENGNSLVLLNGRNTEDQQPAMIVSSPGSLRARYVDADTGQITINNVYSD
ncbi:MAG: hypothetical protein H7039_14850 [Bryobacteraceae bacterium]|nr:hypothetical protein [Bryobacteraceae bacterium]